MRLSDLDLIKILPHFMRNDEAVKGLAAGVNKLTPRLYRQMILFSVWDKIEDMGHSDLDELAWELNVEWYDTGAGLETKRQLIKQADLVHSRLGTKWAVEQVISAHFGTGKLYEWFEYGGKPHHFRVMSNDAGIAEESIDKFHRILSIVKRESSWLEGIIINRDVPMQTHIMTGAAGYTEITLRPVITPRVMPSDILVSHAVHEYTYITITPAN